MKVYALISVGTGDIHAIYTREQIAYDDASYLDYDVRVETFTLDEASEECIYYKNQIEAAEESATTRLQKMIDECDKWIIK